MKLYNVLSNIPEQQLKRAERNHRHIFLPFLPVFGLTCRLNGADDGRGSPFSLLSLIIFFPLQARGFFSFWAYPDFSSEVFFFFLREKHA